MNIHGCNLAKMQYLIYPLCMALGRPMLGMDDALENYDKYDKAYLA